MKVCPRCGLKYSAEQSTCFVDATPLEPYADARLGQTVAGRYVLEAVLGRGPLAVVYRARHRLVERPCAIKIMDADLAGVAVVRERFRREAKATQKVTHPNVVEIFDQGETESGELYLVMELLEGETLAARLHRGPLSLALALQVSVQIARALARAHDLDVVHRDLTPENVFLTASEDAVPRVVLLDFGISRSMQDERLTGVGEIFGTPQYMAPERITSIDAGPSGDLYAMGVMMFEAVTGRLPFVASRPADYLVLHLQEPPPRLGDVHPGVPDALEKLVAALLAKDPEARPVDARRVVQDLTAISGVLGVQLPPESGGSVDSSERAATLPPADLDVWGHRLAVFERMVGVAFGDHAPPPVRQDLERLRQGVEALEALRGRSLQQQRSLEQLEARGREGRQRFGHAVDALGADVSQARDEARSVSAAVAAARARTEADRQQVLRSHEDVIHWEGRSGFAEPHVELAAAYRAMAAEVDGWFASAQEARRLEREGAEKRGVVADLEFQAEELRQALARFQQGIEDEQAACNRELRALGAHTDELDRDLVTVASSLAGALRGKPELRGLFRELERGRA